LIPDELSPVFQNTGFGPHCDRLTVLAAYVACITSWNALIVRENWMWAPLLSLRSGWQWKKKGICETRITNLSTIMHFYKKIDCKLLSTIAILAVGNYSEPKHTLC
jgi:hypothetical protein